jgi:catechol-2,3-dioxygenase
MAVTGVLRPGYVQMRVLDMEQAIPHYRDRVGLDQVGETEGDRAFFRGFDEFDRHGSVAKIVKLEHAWRRLDGRNDDGFQVAPFPG